MAIFEGTINGKFYTNEKEFNEALSKLDKEDGVFVSYSYKSGSGIFNDRKLKDNRNFSSRDNYVDENQYIKNITNETKSSIAKKMKEIADRRYLWRIIANKYESLYK